MKENKYDDNIFFQKYSQMSRSQQGLAGAGEWETLRKLLPDFKDKRVLDLGCGYGWHCIYAMEHGASSVVGVDISHKMLEVAKEKTHFPQIEYKCCAMEDVEFPEESFDVILSSLAFHYVADYEILVKKIYRILKSGGKLVFTVEHPVFTAYGTQDWYYNEKGEILHFPVDNYYYEEERINEYELNLFIREDAESETEGDLYRRFRETHFQRAYTLEEITRIVEESGLQFVTAYEAFTKEPPSKNSERIYVIAREQGKVPVKKAE